MATQIRQEFPPASKERPEILTLDEALALDMGRANQLYARHLNRHLLEIYAILGLDELDVRAAEGITLHLADGRQVMDFSTGMGAAGLGHNHPRVLAAERLCHERRVLDITKLSPHKLQAALAYNLAQILPDPLDTSFFATSGAEANEAAMKLAERVQTRRGKTKFLCMQGAFHGKTHGALALTTATQVHTGFLLGVPKENVVYVPYGDLEALRHAIATETGAKGNSIIAAIIEPIRGTACEVPPPGYLSRFVELCRENDILSIFDEVKVGCGRTGRFCAFMHENVVPDIVTLAKTLGGGKRAIGAMVTSRALFERAYGNRNDCNLHSSTFSGIGETCAVAIETLNTLYEDGLIDNASEMGDYLEARLEALRIKYPKMLLDVRGRGLFRAIRLNFREDLAAKLVDVSSNPLFLTYQTVLIGAVARQLFERHAILVHFQPGARDILHFMPPFVVTRTQIDQLIDGLADIFDRGIADSALRFRGGQCEAPPFPFDDEGLMYLFRPQDALVQAQSRPRLDGCYAVGFPLLAAMLFLLSTHHGIGILPDSTRYMNLSTRPWDAPLYPGMLHMTAAGGIDIVQAAWGIGLLLSVLNAFLTWHVLRVASGRTAYAALGTALILFAPQSVALYALAMSEPLFITMILLTLIALLRYFGSDDERWLIAVGVGIGLASLVRFTGPPLGAAIGLFLLIDPRYGSARRIANLARILLPSALLFLGWALLSEEISGRSTGRPLEWLGNMAGDDWWASFNSLTAWIVPDEVPVAIRSALFLMTLGASLVLMVHVGRHALHRAKGGHPDPSLLAIPLGLLFFTYLGFMVMATAIEANLHLNSRYAYPIYCTSIMAVTIALARVRTMPGRMGRLHGAMAGLACFMLMSHALRSADRTHEAYREGIGYASLRWVRSPTLAAVAALPRDAVIYSNGPDAIGYVLRRPARNIPAHFMLRTGREDPAFPYAAQLAEARDALGRGNTYVVFLKGVDWRFYMASEAELVRRLKLIRIGVMADGTIYRSAEESVS